MLIKINVELSAQIFYPLISCETIIARGKQQTKCNILKTEYSDAQNTRYAQNTEKHLA